MDTKKLMTVHEVVEFFASTHEFKVTNAGENITISYTNNDKTISASMMKEHINVQQLIRKVKQLVWNHANNIFD